MQTWVQAWLRRAWVRKWWLVALLLYKVGEDRILSGVNDALDQIVGPDISAFVVQAIPWLTWLAVPLTIAAILYLGYRDSEAGNGPYQSFGKEWASKNQDGHWNGVRELAIDVRSDLKDAASKPSVTLKDLTNMKARVDSLEVQVAAYEEVWGLGASFWDPRSHREWERSRGQNIPPEPAWALPLWRRIEYATWWLYRHTPQFRPPAGYGGWDPWAGWSDMGS